MKPATYSKTPIRLNRNFMNFPLARDPRAQVEWNRGIDTRRWMAYLPGEDREACRIRLSLPANAGDDVKHCPSGFDINLLFQLLAEAQRNTGTTTIKFASAANLLRRLGLESRNRNRVRLFESLLYWSELSIRWPRWYQDRQRTKLTLPPPVIDVDRPGNQIIVTLHPDWLKYACTKGYYAWVPLPLPAAAAAQNLVLLILTSELKP